LLSASEVNKRIYNIGKRELAHYVANTAKNSKEKYGFRQQANHAVFNQRLGYVSGVAQWLGSRSLAGGPSLTDA